MKGVGGTRLRIAVAILGTESGGLRTFLLNQYAQAAAFGIDFEYVALQGGPVCNELLAAGASVSVIHCPLPKNLPGAPIRTLAKWFLPSGGFFATLRKLNSHVTHLRPECLYSHFLHTHILFGILGRRLGLPRVGHVHGTMNPKRLFGLTRFSYSFALACSLDTIVVISKTARDSLAPVARPKAVLVYNGIDTRFVERSSEGVVKTPGRIAALGRLVPGKKFEVAIRAVAALIHAGVDCTFEIVGGPLNDSNEYATRLKQLVKDLKVEKRITFAGPVNPPYQLLAGAQMLVNCSTVEGLSYVIMESFLCRTPVIVADEGSPSEMIHEEHTGLHFRAGDSEALAAAILRLLRDSELRERLSQGGLMYARETFDIRMHMETMRRIFEKTIDSKRIRSRVSSESR